ncbi:hypothetical protein HNP93_000645 [Methanococcus maripaludis]|uniref:Glycosyl transferase family 11 n=1 Tax=Methanococcus maripaludis TaxID=39152 RepID=A0A7J9P599_METMI|nr:alpha-1,2-fucosyltransferase [Methanococcus maripaludis]MBA2857944.1 hypothetical protein [Methanococcus maripaludis]
MKIVQLKGGLGNQMFQYALYKSLKEMGQEVLLDRSWYLKNNAHNGYELERVFGLSPDHASKKQCLSLGDIPINLAYKIKRKVFPKKTHYFEKHSFNYDKSVFEVTSRYFEGYWQNENYFKSFRSEILKDFSFKNINKKNAEFSKYLNSVNSISIHVRRGDYVNNPKALKVHGNICNLGYYNKAIMLLTNKLDDLKFVIFSDDILWCKSNLNIDNPIFVDWNTGMNSYQDMYLMSKCKHNIIANSSFSWWGAWLNQNSEKLIFAPKKWVNDRSDVNIVPDGWIKLK